MQLISIATRCATVEAFVDLFTRYIDPDDHALFIAAPVPRMVGTSAPFQIRLRDGTIILRGESQVLRSWSAGDDQCPWARPGYCIKLVSLEPDAADLYRRLIEGAQAVSPLARQTVPPVALEIHAREAPDPDTGEIDGSGILPIPPPPPVPVPPTPTLLPASASEGKQSADPLWGALPAPHAPRRGPGELLRSGGRAVRRSRPLQIVSGAAAGAIVGTTLALLTHGGGDPAKMAVAPPTPPAATRAPATPSADPASPAPRPVKKDPEREPERAKDRDRDRGKPAKPKAAAEAALVVLDLRSEPPGATFFVDGNRVGKAPLKVKVEPGRKVKISARLKGYAEWTKRIFVKEKDRHIAARLEKDTRF